jgi:hypothetical protein
MKSIFKKKANEIIESIVKKQKRTEAGSLPFLFRGNIISEQSFYIKVGRNFEKWFTFIAENSIGFELLQSGITKKVIGGKSKDIDFIILNKKSKIIYYYELKANIEMDTEKWPATIDKVLNIKKYLTKQYPKFKIQSGILHWAVYDKNVLPKKYLCKIKQAEDNNVNIVYPKTLFQTLKQSISEKDYYDMFKNITKTYLK